jgi:putative hydrolase of the HAD superfamily
MSPQVIAARPIRGLLLDFGGVVSRSLFEHLDGAESRLRLPAGTLAWRGPLDPSTDALWQSMQRGEITERGYWEIRAREVGELAGRSAEEPAEEGWSVQAFMRRVRAPDPCEWVRPQARQAIRAAKRQGLRVGVLSNELELFYGKELLARIDILREIDCVVDATHTGVLKPDPLAYALGLEALGTPAAETLFVDDQPANVEGARHAGLRALRFEVRDPEESYGRVNAWVRTGILPGDP